MIFRISTLDISRKLHEVVGDVVAGEKYALLIPFKQGYHLLEEATEGRLLDIEPRIVFFDTKSLIPLAALPW